MTPIGKKNGSWPQQLAVVVSESPNLHMVVRELVRSAGWRVLDAVDSADRAVDLVRKGEAFLIILDDSPRVPATSLIRQIVSNPITLCTPILAFLTEAHRHEAAAFATLGRTASTVKPLTPSKFAPAFSNMIRNWEKAPLLSLRRANYLFLAGKDADGFKALGRLMDFPGVGPVASQSLALHLRSLGKTKEAETVLLKTLKKSPRDLGTVIALAHLYQEAAMPALALRLLSGVRNTYQNSVTMVPDMVHCHLQLGSLGEAITLLDAQVKAGDQDLVTTAILARLLFAEGRESEAERALVDSKALFKRLQGGWSQVDAPATGAAS